MAARAEILAGGEPTAGGQGRSQEFVLGGINYDQSALSRSDNAFF